MIDIVRYNESYENIWNEFNSITKNNIFMFNRSYMDYHRNRYVDHSILFFCDDELIAILPCSEHEKILISHGGLTWGGIQSTVNMKQSLMLECIKALTAYCSQNGFLSIVYKSVPSIYSNQPADEDIFAMNIFNSKISKIEASTVVDLRNPIKMSHLRVRQIKKAMKNAVDILIDDEYMSYIKYMAIQDEVLFKYHHVHAVHSADEIYKLHLNFPDKIHLYTAVVSGEIVGGSIVYIYDNVVHTQYLCANDMGRRIGALDLTISKIIEDYKNTHRWLDFGISTENGGKFLNEGLINQKEGFGGRTKVYYTWNIDI